ncbi:MAG: nascent polypeptide-associated complex protein [Candidatus Aenigmatarchaeota archaeon]
MEKMVKQLGITTENIPADQVIIRSGSKEIVIDKPNITKVKIAGQDTFQIIGEISERLKEKFSEDDVKLVASQAGASMDDAKKALEETGDIAAAIMKLKQ